MRVFAPRSVSPLPPRAAASQRRSLGTWRRTPPPSQESRETGPRGEEERLWGRLDFFARLPAGRLLPQPSILMAFGRGRGERERRNGSWPGTRIGPTPKPAKPSINEPADRLAMILASLRALGEEASSQKYTHALTQSRELRRQRP